MSNLAYNVEVYKQVKDYSYIKTRHIKHAALQTNEADGKGLIPVNASEVLVQYDVNCYNSRTYNLNYVVWSRIPCYIPENQTEIRLSSITGSADPRQANIFLDAFPNVITNNNNTVEIKFRAFYNHPYLQSDNPNRYKEITLITDKVNQTTTVSIGDEVEIESTELIGGKLSVIRAQGWETTTTDTKTTTCIELDELGTRLQLYASNDDIIITTISSRLSHHGVTGSGVNESGTFIYIDDGLSKVMESINDKADELEEEIDHLEDQITLASNYFITR